MIKGQSITVQIIECRWCKKKVAPDFETGIYPKKCPGRSCRRQTWNKSDKEITKSVKKRISALFENHKDGNVGRKKSLTQTKKEFLTSMGNKSKTFVCVQCELMFGDENALKRHQERRNHVVD